MSKTFGKYSSQGASTTAPKGGKTQQPESQSNNVPPHRKSRGQQTQSRSSHQGVEHQRAVEEMAEMLRGATLGKVQINLSELSACGMWGLALSMAIKALIPGTLNYLAVTSLALMLANWGGQCNHLTSIRRRAQGSLDPDWSRRYGLVPAPSPDGNARVCTAYLLPQSQF